MNKMKDYNSKISTKYVSHFTKEFPTLLKIVENGFRPHIPKQGEVAIEEQPTATQKEWAMLWGDIEQEEPILRFVPMVCFCDIPLELARKHREQYGNYCIALTKEWAIKSLISPVIYLPQDSLLHSLLKKIVEIEKKLPTMPKNEDTDNCRLKEHIEKLRGYIKAYMSTDGKTKYYDEREWRYVPEKTPFNESDTALYLHFDINDFAYAIVETPKEKEALLILLREKFGNKPKDKDYVVKIVKGINNSSASSAWRYL